MNLHHMTVGCVYTLYGFLVKQATVCDMFYSLNDDEYDAIGLDYDEGSCVNQQFQINDKMFTIVDFTHDDKKYSQFCVVGIRLCETHITGGDKTIDNWNVIKGIMNDEDNNRKKIQAITYYLSKYNIPYDIITNICQMAQTNTISNLFSPLLNHPFLTKMINTNSTPDFYVVQNDCHCCS